MPHTRKSDQAVDAFSAPKDLLALAKRRAAELKMTKSGYFRYCLAKDLGYSDNEARDLAAHNVVRQLREEVAGSRYPKHRPDNLIMNEKVSSEEPSSLAKSVEAGLAARRKKA